MRVVAGSARGRRLVAPKGDLVRPTSDRVKESVFNALGSLDVLDGAVVLDLFAGSGALGIEALSRGASRATFVDDHPRSIAAVRANLAATGFEEQARVARADVLAYLGVPPPAEEDAGHPSGPPGEAPRLVFADPPYRFDRWPELLAAVAAWAGGAAWPRPRPPAQPVRLLAVVESDRELAIPTGWDLLRSRTYGSTVMTFLQIRRAASDDVSGDVAARGDAPAADVTRGQEE